MPLFYHKTKLSFRNFLKLSFSRSSLIYALIYTNLLPKEGQVKHLAFSNLTIEEIKPLQAEKGLVMIILHNGFSFEHKIASGASGFDGKFWPWEKPLVWSGLIDPSLFLNTTKTLTLPPRRGNFRWWNPSRCVRLIPGGAVNTFGLTNKGFYWWCRKIGPRINSQENPLAVSILGEIRELAEMADRLNDFDIVALEDNASCPNTSCDILNNTEKVIEGVRNIHEISRFPIILKLSVTHDIETIVKETEGMVAAYDINSVPWHIVFPGKPSPLARFGGGGVSGKSAQPHTWALVEKIAQLTSVPVIGPSVWDFEDIAKIRAKGAKAIEWGSIFLKHPLRPTKYIKRDMQQQYS